MDSLNLARHPTFELPRDICKLNNPFQHHPLLKMAFGKLTKAVPNLDISKSWKITSGARGPGTAVNPVPPRESSGEFNTTFDRPQVPRSPRDSSKLVPSPAACAEMKKSRTPLTQGNVDRFVARQRAEEACTLKQHPTEILVIEWLKEVSLP
ncbi:unnamed protein product [Penicillium pancosmium]